MTAVKQMPGARHWPTFKRPRFSARNVLLTLGLTLVLAMGAFVAWAATPAGDILPEARAALTSGEGVSVNEGRWLIFDPTRVAPQTGVILYPGSRVPAEAYAPLARRLAEAGYMTVLVRAPLLQSILDFNAAAPVIEAYPDIERWVVGGHSMGGAAASIYADALVPEHPVDGLVFLASRPAPGLALRQRDDLVIASIYGTLDAIQTQDELDASKDNLPADALYIPLAGGNHSFFGYYGLQSGDHPGTISRAEQQEQLLDAMLRVLQAVERS